MRVPECCYRVRTKDEKGTEEKKEETRKFTTKSVLVHLLRPRRCGKGLGPSPEKPENAAAGCLALDGDRARPSPWESAAEKAKLGFARREIY